VAAMAGAWKAAPPRPNPISPTRQFLSALTDSSPPLYLPDESARRDPNYPYLVESVFF
jgi:hypothetical protein